MLVLERREELPDFQGPFFGGPQKAFGILYVRRTPIAEVSVGPLRHAKFCLCQFVELGLRAPPEKKRQQHDLTWPIVYMCLLLHI